MASARNEAPAARRRPARRTRHLVEPLLERADRVRPRRLELGLDLARVEAQRAAEPARDPLHRPVVEQAEHVHPGDEPVAGADHQPPAELGAEAAAPERLLHRDGELGRAGPRPADRLELADRAQLAGDEAAEDDGAAGVALEAGDVGPDVLVAGVPAEPQPAVLAVEAQEVLRQQPAALARREPAEARGGVEGGARSSSSLVPQGRDAWPASGRPQAKGPADEDARSGPGSVRPGGNAGPGRGPGEAADVGAREADVSQVPVVEPLQLVQRAVVADPLARPEHELAEEALLRVAPVGAE